MWCARQTKGQVSLPTLALQRLQNCAQGTGGLGAVPLQEALQGGGGHFPWVTQQAAGDRAAAWRLFLRLAAMEATLRAAAAVRADWDHSSWAGFPSDMTTLRSQETAGSQALPPGRCQLLLWPVARVAVPQGRDPYTTPGGLSPGCLGTWAWTRRAGLTVGTR